MELHFVRMLFPATVLILLSGWASADDVRCYWCGPLAEQVHRSQRAPPCSALLQETTCDPGYSHCAVVATSPPYKESRLCVKFYQDECYSLYCNSSKTWRMICPCQGNFCNGLNTDREKTAFATLAKIAGKKKRSKRSSLTTKGFISIRPRVTTNITNPENETIDSPELTTMDTMINNSDEVVPNTVAEERDTKNIEDNLIDQGVSELSGEPIEYNESLQPDTSNDVTANKEEITPDNINDDKVEPTAFQITTLEQDRKDNETVAVTSSDLIDEKDTRSKETVNPTELHNVIQSTIDIVKATENTEIERETETVMMDIMKTTLSTEMVKDPETITMDTVNPTETTEIFKEKGTTIMDTIKSTMNKDIDKETEVAIVDMASSIASIALTENLGLKQTDSSEATTMMPTTIVVEIAVLNMKKPDTLPPPEALQQTVTPAKVAPTTVPTTITTVESTTNDKHVETTTHAMKETTRNKDNEIPKSKDEKEVKNKKNRADTINVTQWIIIVNCLVFLTL